MINSHELIFFKAALGALLLSPSLAMAYLGPGAGLTAVGSFLALFAAVTLAIVGFVWYPVKRILRGSGGEEPADVPADGNGVPENIPQETSVSEKMEASQNEPRA